MDIFHKLIKFLVSLVPRYRRRIIFEVRRHDPPPILKPAEGIRFEQVTVENVDMLSHYCSQSEVESRRKQLAQGDLGLYAFCDDRAVGQGWASMPSGIDRLLSGFLPVTSDTFPLRSFSVDPQFRGRKIYQHLLAEIAKLAFSKTNASRLLGNSYDDNYPSLAALERAGFHRICIVPIWEWRSRTIALKKIPDYKADSP